MDKETFLSLVKGGLVVSCQALPGEPLYKPEGGIMPLMAMAAERAGAVAIRCNGIVDIYGIKNCVKLPVIGIIKKKYPGYEAYITPSMEEVDQLVAINTDVIAVDSDFIKAIKEKYPSQLLMADCSSYEDAKKAFEAGVDFVGTTISGYTDNSKGIYDGPNFDLVKKIVDNLDVPVIAEGRIHTPEDATKMLRLGALAVVVGGAITRPLEIAERFVHAMKIVQDAEKRQK